ncbi:MAG: phosphatase PAP2 family protein [Bacilli bacterium]|nr:phosphatase PAP2 family protein [Bacilli bacterium]MDD4705673.1 phosphatase PAP2 family protein [Bacilli bacterium]
MKKIIDLKFYLITAIGLLTFSGFFYFFVKLLEGDPILIGSTLDTYIPFLPIFIYIYNIWYPFNILSLYFIFKDNANVYIKTIISLVFCFIISNSIFILYPTTVNRPVINSYNNITEFITYMTFRIDTPATRCFPSNHCILCFIIIFSVLAIKNMSKWKKSMIVAINILIILSTLFVKQHIIYDVIGSLIITVICFYILSRFKFFKYLEKKLVSVS